MFNRTVRTALLGAALGLVPLSAQAVVQGQVTRNPDGLRASVVRIESSDGEICSGTLVSQDVVLTAAHCVMGKVGYSVVVTDPDFRQRRIRAVAATMHPEFVPGTTPEDQPGIDLAMLKLGQQVGPGFRPLDPRGGAIGTGDHVDIAGYGVVAENKRNTARVLRTARLVGVGSLQVANRVSVVTDAHRLAETAGAGACLGDSGGPILRGGQMVGVVSWSSGALQQDKRARTACGGFTAVTPTGEHDNWIVSRIEALEAMQPAPEAMLVSNSTQWVAKPGRKRNGG